MLRSWWAWGITTFFMALYVAVARVESTPTRAELELRPGNEIALTVFRVFNEEMRAGLYYREDCALLPSGAFSPFQTPSYKAVPGYLVHTPAPMIRLEISNDNGRPLLYEAVPGGNCGPISRRLTANLSIAPGLYPRSPPLSTPWLYLGRFRNNLRIKVAEIDPQILGRKVDIAVWAPLGFKEGDPSLFFFWFAFFLEPVFWFTQSIWLLSLLVNGWRSITRKDI